MLARSIRLEILIPSLLTLLVACGGSSSSGAAPTAAPVPTPVPMVKTAIATVDGKSVTILVSANDMTLYYSTPDKGGKITCAGPCLGAWPPLVLAAGQTTVTAAKDIPGAWSTAPNPDGKGIQVIYNNWPLYFWAKDMKPGDTTGQNVGGKWFVATPGLQASA